MVTTDQQIVKIKEDVPTLQPRTSDISYTIERV